MHVHPNKTTVAVRTVAVFEAAKGIIVLLLGLGVLRLVHKDVDDVAEQIIRFLHASPGGHLSNLFIAAAHRANDKSLWAVAAAAMVYALVRFAEAYGLWYERDWAEWFALLSGAMYLPWEVLSIMRHSVPLKWVVLILNLVIVLYMLMLRLQAAARQKARAHNPSG
jgi:uncharacterized membrane protein (DUF2068 family)